MIDFEVRMNFEYRNRDGSVRDRLKASNRFSQSFVPTLGWRIGVNDGDNELSSKVSEIWWNTGFTEKPSLIVHTERQIFSDGDVNQIDEHENFLRSCGWLTNRT